MEDEELYNSSPTNTVKEDPTKAKRLNDKFKSNNYVNKTKGLNELINVSQNRRFYNTGLGESKYDSNLNWNAEINENDIQGSINEHRSEEQGLLPTIGAGLGRVASKVTREVLKTAGAVGGLGAGIVGQVGDLLSGEDNVDFLPTVFDNTFIRGVDKAFDTVNKELLPVYVSDAVENGKFWDKVTSSEFWATEGADGAGYLISAMIPGAALKGLNVSNKLFGTATKLTALRYGKNLEVARRALTQAGMTTGKIDSFIIPTANTFFEAGAEAKGVGDGMDSRKNEFITNIKQNKEFQDELMSKLQDLDDRRRRGLITIEEQNELTSTLADDLANEKFREQKGYAMRNTFLTNLAILAGPNYIQSKILYGKNGAKNLLNQVRKSPVKQGLRRVGETFLSEGSEEVAQTSTEQRQTKKGISGQLHGGWDSFKDVSPLEFGVDFIKTLGTTEGQVAGFLGGILGSPISVIQGHKQDTKDYAKSTSLRTLVEATGTSLNDIHLPTHKMKTTVNPETGEEVEDFELDEQGNKIPIPENIVKVKNALDKHEALSKLYDEAVEIGNVEAVDAIKKVVEHDLIMNFINEDEMSLDALKEHLKETLPTNSEDKQQNSTNSKRQSELIEKAKYLQKELVSFQDMSTNIIKLENENATPQEVSSFMGSLANEFLSESSKLYDLRKKLNTLRDSKSDVEKQTTLVEKDNPLYQEGFSNELDKKVKVRENPRLDLLNSKIEDVEKEIKETESFLNFGVWNSKIVNGAFNATLKQNQTIKENIEPAKVQTVDDILAEMKAAQTIDELDAIDLKNNPGLIPHYNQRKRELEDLERERREIEVQNQQILAAEEELKKEEDLEILKTFTTSNTVGDIVINPISQVESTIEEITNNSITLKNLQTGEMTKHVFPVITDDGSADDVDTVIPVTGGTTFNDHITPGVDVNNPEYIQYLTSVKNKKGDIVTFELRSDKLNAQQKELFDIVKSGDIGKIAEKRQQLIDSLPLNFIYNNGQAKSWSSFKGSNADLLRTSIIDALIQGNKIEDLSTHVTNQKSPSFNTEFDNGKPVKNNPLEIKFIKDLDKNNPENKVTLYHVNNSGDLILVTNNNEPLDTSIKEKIQSQSGQIFLVIKNPKDQNIPVKLNFSKLNPAKASTLAKLYGEILKDSSMRTSSLNVLKAKNLDLFNEVNKILKDEVELLGNKPAIINLGNLIEVLVHETSGTNQQGINTSIVLSQDNNGVNYITYRDTIYDLNNIDELGFALQDKYQNVISITSAINVNKDLNFKNPNYIKYLFDKGVLTTNLNLETPFKVATENGGKNPKVDTGSELFISSTVTVKNNNVTVTPPVVKQNSSLQNKIEDIERRRQEELSKFVISNVKTNLYDTPILLDPNAKSRGDKQQYISRELFDIAYSNDNREGAGFQTADTLIRRGGYTKGELLDGPGSLLFPEIEKINFKYDAELANLTKFSQPQTTSLSEQETIDRVLKEFNDIKNDILSKLNDEVESVKGNAYTVNKDNVLVKGKEVLYNDKGIIFNGKLLAYNLIENSIQNTIKKNFQNNPQNVRNSQNNSVPLQNNNITIKNDVNIAGTQDNLDYIKAFEGLQVVGEDIVEKENLEKTLLSAQKSYDTLIKVKPQVAERHQKIMNDTKDKSLKLAEKIRCGK